MCRKVIFVTSVVLVMSLAGKAPAQSTWTGNGDGVDWCSASNWDGGVPGPGEIAWLDGTPAQGPTIGVGCDANVGTLRGPCWVEHGAPLGTTQNIDITGGTLAVTGNWHIDDVDDKDGEGHAIVNISGDSVVKVEGEIRGQDGADGNTVINISGNADVYVGGIIRAGETEGAWFEFNMSGGDVNCGGLAAKDDGSGRISITGGELICRGGIQIRATNGTAEFTLDGGARVEVRDGLACPSDDSGTGTVLLNSGTLICGSFSPSGEDWTMDIDGGAILEITNNNQATKDQMQGYIDAGYITGKDDTEDPCVVIIGGSTFVGFNLYQGEASNPYPTSPTGNICPSGGLTLTWDAGDRVQDTNGHEVFFGTSWADVNSMTDPCAIKNVGDETYDTGPLEYAQGYYWRVDEVNIADACTWRGSIWQFSTYPGTASDPSPPSGRRGLPPGDIDLTWGEFPCQRLTGQTLYYGTDVLESVVLFEDDFETGGFDPNWSVYTGWSIYDANDDSNFAPRDDENYVALATAGTLTSRDIDASDYANSINVSLAILLDKGVGSGEVTLNYYNGSTYVPVADWNENDPCDTWHGYSDTITDSQFLISNFRIQLVSTLAGPNTVAIDDVKVRNTWPVFPEWVEAELGPADDNYPVTIGQFENYGWRLDMNDGNNIIQGAYWTFTTGYGGLLMHYKFDGTPGNPLPSVVPDDSDQDIEFTKYIDGGSLTYGESNPDTIASTASADFEPNVALFRLDPCGPSERTRDLLRLNGDFTIEMWVMPRNLTDEENVWLISKRDAWGLRIHTSNNYNFRGVWGIWGSTENDTVVQDEWTHIAWVSAQYDPEEEISNIYLNGIDVGDAGGLPPADNNNPIWIGANQLADGSLEGHFDGLIDEIRIHDIALGPCAFLIGPGHPEYAICPVPRDGEQDVDPCGVVLSWTPGESATSHKVYFGSEFAKVDALDTSVKIYEGSNTMVPLDDLEDSTRYHWRVVEVGDGGPWEGEIWNFTTTYVITDDSLRVWYRLDESWGDDAYDSSGRAYHADVDNAAGDEWDPEGGKRDGCLVFDNDISLEPDDEHGIFDTLTSGITVAVWLNSAIGGGGVVFGTGEEDSEYILQAVIPDDDGDVVWRAGNDSNDLMIWNDATPTAWEDGWHHLAFVKDEVADTMSIYFDGLLAKTQSGTIDTLTNILSTSPFRIGCNGWDDEDYEGRMDDFRIYDRVLTDANIAKLVRGDDLDIAWGPDPYDDQPNASRDANLTWFPGDNAADHNVFFGTTKSEVEEMTDACATLGLGTELYDPGPLQLDTWYYWRIDEVNDPCTWTGPVWRFKVADFIMLDDFEQYDNVDNRVYYTWVSGRKGQEGEETGSWLTLAKPPSYPVHGGSQSVEYWYNTNDSYALYKYAEAWLPLSKVGFQDWTSVDVSLLTLFFYGDQGNPYTPPLEQMYVGVKDTAGLYGEMRYGDHPGEALTDIQVEEWQRWDIPFVWFTDSNSAAPDDVNFASVESVHIGFGNRRTPVAGGEGFVWFDDIRLNMPYCRPEYGPTGDLNGDCFVGVGDIAVIGEQWLRGDVNVNPVVNPGTANLVGHWELDGDATDSTSNGYDGTIEDYSYWVVGRIGQYALGLDGGWVVVDDNGVTPELRPEHEVSVMAWINRRQSSSSDIKVVVRGRDDHETYGLEVNDEFQGLTFLMRDANEEDGGNPKQYNIVSEQELPLDEWVHIAGTYDGNEMTSYVNGEVAGTTTPGPDELYSDANDGFGIGGRWGDAGGRFVGEIDDVRVYDRAVTAAELGYIAAGPTGIIELDSEANLYDGEDPEVINFKDFAKLFDNWGAEILWPPTPAP